MMQQPLVGKGLLIIDASRSQSNTQHSVGLLWASDQPDAGTSTWQDTTLTTEINAPDGIRTFNPNKRAAADPRLRPRGHRDELQEEMLEKKGLSPGFVMHKGIPIAIVRLRHKIL